MAITYTKTGLAAVIADDLARPDLSSQIDNAIEHAIGERQDERFFFNETNSTSFDTVANQATYATSDDADIPLFYEVDGLVLEDSDGNRFDLGEPIDPVRMQLLQASAAAATGQPYEYAYFDESFVFDPVPDAVYTIYPVGHIEIAIPAADDAGNPWMTQRGAFWLIHADAKAYLYAHVIKDTEQAAVMVDAAQGAVAKLRSRTSRKKASGTITPTSW